MKAKWCVGGRLAAGIVAAGVVPAAFATTDLGVRTEAGTLAAPNPFTVRVTGLTPNAHHACRVRASNDWGVVASDWEWFVTRPADFITIPGAVGWAGGGSYDGYDSRAFSGAPRGAAGTVITIR